MGPLRVSRTDPKQRVKLLQRPSPNCGERRDGAKPEIVVLHYTAMESADAACRTLCNPDTEVSAHYLIGEDGAVFQLVEEEDRAWHAGAGSWQGRGDVNSRSIGIELANTGFAPFSEPLMRSLEELLEDILLRRSITPEQVIAHSDLAPGRKIDPGRRFDWRRLARRGLSVWPDWQSAAPNAQGFREALTSFGYPSDVPEETRVAAFRLRFNPGEAGALNGRDMGMALALQDRAWLKFSG